MERGTPCLIFVSAHESFVFDAQAFMPLWFVRKSMLGRDMYKALQKNVELTEFKKACCMLKGGPVYIRDIMYIECSGHLLTIQMVDKNDETVWKLRDNGGGIIKV